MAALIALALSLVDPGNDGADRAGAPPPDPSVAPGFELAHRDLPRGGADTRLTRRPLAGDGPATPAALSADPDLPPRAGRAGAALPRVLPETPTRAGGAAGPPALASPDPGPPPDRLTPAIRQGETALPREAMAGRGTAIGGPGALDADHLVVPPDTIRSADIWQTPALPPPPPEETRIETLYLAAIDPGVTVDDAFALVMPSADYVPPSPPYPPPARGRVFELDERGLVIAAPEGTENPDGIIVYAGRPPVVPPSRPVTAIIAANRELALALAGKRPRARPADLVEQTERAQLGGRSREELAGLRPRPRPASLQTAAEQERRDGPASTLAVARSLKPEARPGDFARRVAVRAAVASAATTEERVEGLEAEPPARSAQPSIPTSASVARQATITNALNLRQLNLIGVYGSDNDRRALVRLPSGRYVKVQVGDRIDGGRVSAIGNNNLRYDKGSRSVMLVVPSG